MDRVRRGLAAAAALAALQGCSWLGIGGSGDVAGSGKEVARIEPPAKADAARDQKDALVIGFDDTVYFEYEKATLSADALPVLKHLADWMQQHPDVRLRVEGHADERGTREYNLALGERRAMAVRSYLAALGVPEQRLDTVSYGKERPAVVGSNEAAWAKNRRALAEIE